MQFPPAEARRPGRRCRSSPARSRAPRASAARACSGVLFCCDRCAATMCCSRDVSMRARIVRRRLVVQMAEAPGDPLLQRARIVASREQVEVVVALEHQRVAAGQARLDVRRRHADVGQHAEPARAVADDELHRLARVVRHRERPDLERRRSRTRRGCRSRRRASMPSKRAADRRQRAERRPDRDPVARRERRHAADVIGVLVGDEDRGQRVRGEAERARGAPRCRARRSRSRSGRACRRPRRRGRCPRCRCRGTRSASRQRARRRAATATPALARAPAAITSAGP